MMRLRRAAACAAAAVAPALAAVALAAAPSSAGVFPDPYSSSTDTGTVRYVSALGTGACGQVNVGATFAGVALGANGIVTAATGSTCSGILTGSQLLLGAGTIGVSIAGDSPGSAMGTVRLTGLALSVRTILATCLYTGTATGRVSNGMGTMTASGLLSRSSGGSSCDNPGNVSITLVSGGSITW